MTYTLHFKQKKKETNVELLIGFVHSIRFEQSTILLMMLRCWIAKKETK